ncbi:hypothetical protein LINGRAHAP2_LOCUS15588 [Linum grandiflorum]
MILKYECPLSIVDNLYFKQLCCTLQPLFKVPTRNTIKKDILNTIGEDGNIIGDDDVTEAMMLID